MDSNESTESRWVLIFIPILPIEISEEVPKSLQESVKYFFSALLFGPCQDIDQLISVIRHLLGMALNFPDN